MIFICLIQHIYRIPAVSQPRAIWINYPYLFYIQFGFFISADIYKMTAAFIWPSLYVFRINIQNGGAVPYLWKHCH